MIKDNLEDVEKNIVAACKKSGRNRNEVTLIAVSKTKPVEAIQEVLAENIYEFGENKVQELCDKYESLPNNIHWHLIGHLQRNKVKYLVGKVHLIHSVDSLRLAEQIEHDFGKHDLTANILIQVNVANEETKFGLDTSEVLELITETAKLPHVKIKGLMTVAPFTDNPEDNRQIFAKLKQLSVDIAAKNIDNVSMDILSMGMSGDYQVAIEEGATMIRVGTNIFGARNYNR
ncbi:MAG: YggS family pyridoxal phosphate-dependent enzyme [Eubacterium sp.]